MWEYFWFHLSGVIVDLALLKLWQKRCPEDYEESELAFLVLACLVLSWAALALLLLVGACFLIAEYIGGDK